MIKAYEPRDVEHIPLNQPVHVPYMVTLGPGGQVRVPLCRKDNMRPGESVFELSRASRFPHTAFGMTPTCEHCLTLKEENRG